MNSDETRKNDRTEGIQQDYEMEADTVANTIHILDNINRQIKAAERRLNNQRVNTAILTVELATLHDPLMRETLALCTQASEDVVQKIAECREFQEQMSQAVQSGTQQIIHGKPQKIKGLKTKEPQSPMPDSPQVFTHQEPNLIHTRVHQPPRSQTVQVDSVNRYDSDLQDEGQPSKRSRLTDGPTEDTTEAASQRRAGFFNKEEAKSLINDVTESSSMPSVSCNTLAIDSSDHHQGSSAMSDGTQSIQHEYTSGNGPCTETNLRCDELLKASNKAHSDFTNGTEVTPSDSVPVHEVNANESLTC
ncbi:uncharacterized protein [Panulirus ornatus]|uniref:uncharacterized protein n=1 Tax=Panulirus ornatus TaxID=150431 RepID=UPI003A897447